MIDNLRAVEQTGGQVQTKQVLGVATRVSLTIMAAQGAAMIDGQYWRNANSGDPVVPAPKLPAK